MHPSHESLKKYLFDKTRGLVRITEKETDDIAKIIRGGLAYGVCYKHNAVTNSYEKQFTKHTSPETIADLVDKYKSTPQYKEFYRWELFNENDVLMFSFYTFKYDLIP